MNGKRWDRLTALLRKEARQLLRDRRTLMMILVLPLIQLLIFAYAIHLTVSNIPTALVDQSLDEQSRGVVRALVNSGYFQIALNPPSQQGAMRAIESGDAKIAVVIPPDFAVHIARGDANMLILVDGSDQFNIESGYTAATAIAQQYSFKLIEQKVNRAGVNQIQLPLTVVPRVLYNPDSTDLVFVLPGLVGLVLQQLAIANAGLSVVRERETGTLEQLLTTPIRPLELMLGKLLPALVVQMLDMALIVGIGVVWFKVPFQGSLPTFLVLSVLFASSSLGLGLLVSTISQTQKQAQQIANLFSLFSMMLSGFLYPIESMPLIPRLVSNVLPLTYFLRISRGIMTKGVGLNLLWSDTLYLVAYGVVIIGLAALTFRKRLD